MHSSLANRNAVLVISLSWSVRIHPTHSKLRQKNHFHQSRKHDDASEGLVSQMQTRQGEMFDLAQTRKDAEST